MFHRKFVRELSKSIRPSMIIIRHGETSYSAVASFLYTFKYRILPQLTFFSYCKYRILPQLTTFHTRKHRIQPLQTLFYTGKHPILSLLTSFDTVKNRILSLLPSFYTGKHRILPLLTSFYTGKRHILTLLFFTPENIASVVPDFLLHHQASYLPMLTFCFIGKHYICGS